MSNKATIAFMVVYGIIMHCSVHCSPTGVKHPGFRVEDEAYDEEGNSLPDLTYETDRNGIRISSSTIDDMNTLYYPPEKRTERHADGLLNKRLRALMAQEITREIVHSLIPSKRDGHIGYLLGMGLFAFVMKIQDITVHEHNRVGELPNNGSSVVKDTEPLSKRHSDGIFTDSYSRYRKQMAVKKYLAAVLGKSPEDINITQIFDDIDIDALLRLLEGDYDIDFGELLQQISMSAN